MSKARHYRRHARYRALQRFGIDLTPDLHAEILARIQAGTLKCLERTATRSVFEVDVGGTVMKVVYSRTERCLMTVLEQGMA